MQTIHQYSVTHPRDLPAAFTSSPHSPTCLIYSTRFFTHPGETHMPSWPHNLTHPSLIPSPAALTHPSLTHPFHPCTWLTWRPDVTFVHMTLLWLIQFLHSSIRLIHVIRPHPFVLMTHLRISHKTHPHETHLAPRFPLHASYISIIHVTPLI